MDHSAGLLALINANWTTQAVRAACELDIPGHLARGDCSLDQLADAGCHAPSLRRLLRALATLGVCVQTQHGHYALAPMGRLLCDDHPQSLRAWALLVGGPHWARWAELHESVRTGRSFKQRHLGEEGFGDLDADPAAAALFHRAMVQMTRRTAAAIVSALPIGEAACVVDVGGGQGELLAKVLQAHSSARGVLFDLPTGLAGAQEALARAGVLDRCRMESGDFFAALPEGGDIYLLKSVLHNWDDERAAHILKNCRKAMRPGAMAVAIERAMPSQPETTAAERTTARSDLNMLLALTGRERTHAEFDALFARAGLGPATLVATGGEFSLIVCGAAGASPP